MKRAVLLDLFETLMTEMPPTLDGPPPPWGVAGRELGIADEAYRQAWAARKDRRMTSELSYVDALVEICGEHGVAADRSVIQRLHDLRQAHRANAFAAVPATVTAMLDDLRAADVRTVVVSNCSVEEAEHLAGSPLAGRVDAVVWSFRVGVQKPDRAIYALACEQVGVAPADAVFVGDGSFDELRGAVDAGLDALWASWFTSRWPSHLAARRREEVERFGVPEAREPADVVAYATATRRPSRR